MQQGTRESDYQIIKPSIQIPPQRFALNAIMWQAPIRKSTKLITKSIHEINTLEVLKALGEVLGRFGGSSESLGACWGRLGPDSAPGAKQVAKSTFHWIHLWTICYRPKSDQISELCPCFAPPHLPRMESSWL